MEKAEKDIRAAIIGSTGAIGKELIRQLVANPAYKEIVVLARRTIDEWKEPPVSERIRVIELPSFDNLAELKGELQGFDVFFCALGSRVGRGKEEFVKVDKTYPIEYARLALECEVPNYSLVSSIGASKSSWFLYMKTKGEAEDEISKIGLKHVTIC